MKLIARLEKSSSFWFLLFISFIFFLLRWPSLFEPYWYGDEGVYQAVGMLLRNGASLYSGAWDNKPPLLYLLYALFNSDQFVIRTVSLIFGLASVWVFYLIARRLFAKSEKSVVIATSFYVVMFGTRIIEGNIANAENFMLLPILISSYFVISTDFVKKIWINRISFLAGLILSLAFLTKMVAVFDFFAFGSFLFVDPEKSFREKFIQKLIPFVLGFSIPVLLVMSYFFVTNSFKDFLNAFLFSNVGYVGYANKFIIPQGLLYLKMVFVASFVFLLLLKRNSVPRSMIFVLIWFSFSLFNAFFSQRPYTHYLLILLPSFTLMIGLIISEKRFRLLVGGFLFVSFVIININFKFHGKLLAYYSNLLAFCSDKQDLNSYQSFFDINTPKDYELARYIKSNTKSADSIFIWGNNAQLYKLTNKPPILRYTVAYHITNYPNAISEMDNAINTKKPKLIIIMPNVGSFPLALNNYNEKVNIRDVKIYEKVP